MVFEELGPTFIKLAQILSTRPDLIPLEFAQELAKRGLEPRMDKAYEAELADLPPKVAA